MDRPCTLASSPSLGNLAGSNYKPRVLPMKIEIQRAENFGFLILVDGQRQMGHPTVFISSDETEMVNVVSGILNEEFSRPEPTL